MAVTRICVTAIVVGAGLAAAQTPCFPPAHPNPASAIAITAPPHLSPLDEALSAAARVAAFVGSPAAALSGTGRRAALRLRSDLTGERNPAEPASEPPRNTHTPAFRHDGWHCSRGRRRSCGRRTGRPPPPLLRRCCARHGAWAKMWHASDGTFITRRLTTPTTHHDTRWGGSSRRCRRSTAPDSSEVRTLPAEPPDLGERLPGAALGLYLTVATPSCAARVVPRCRCRTRSRRRPASSRWWVLEAAAVML